MERLRDEKIVASFRVGAVHLSAHFYNNEDETDRAANLLSNDN